MTPQDMRMLHDPDNGMIGDCDRACLATLLDLHPDSVPHVMADHWGKDDGSWWEARHAWLVARGYVAVSVHARELDGWMPLRALDYLLAVGNGPRGNVHGVVVALDGELVHDPHPSRQGLLDVIEYEVFVTAETWARVQEPSA